MLLNGSIESYTRDTEQGVTTAAVLPRALRTGLSWAHGLSRLNGPKEMPHHEELQSTGNSQLLHTGVMKNKNTPLSFSQQEKNIGDLGKDRLTQRGSFVSLCISAELFHFYI